jgi:ferredoxin
MKRLVIDAERCVGNGRCYSLAPSLVTDDERGYGQVAGAGAVDDEHVEEAERIVRACPEGAVRLLDE